MLGDDPLVLPDCVALRRGRCNFVNLIAAAPELVASVLPAGVRAAPLDTLPQAGFQPLVLPAAHCALTTQSTGKLPLPALDTVLLGVLLQPPPCSLPPQTSNGTRNRPGERARRRPAG